MEEARKELYRQTIPGYDDPPRQSTPEAAQQREARRHRQHPDRRTPTPRARERAAEETSWREARPASETPYVIYLGPPAADELGRVAEKGVEAVTGLADGVEKALGAALDAAADFIAPPPPPTKEQVQQQQRAEEAERPLRETARSKAEWEARLMEQLQDDLRKRVRQREEGYDRDDDYGGRERERER